MHLPHLAFLIAGRWRNACSYSATLAPFLHFYPIPNLLLWGSSVISLPHSSFLHSSSLHTTSSMLYDAQTVVSLSTIQDTRRGNKPASPTASRPVEPNGWCWMFWRKKNIILTMLTDWCIHGWAERWWHLQLQAWAGRQTTRVPSVVWPEAVALVLGGTGTWHLPHWKETACFPHHWVPL